ncbi:hypothetical protein [Acrocarpospora corrugata]|nr:hypothetical protein [Acrocarpospora corrugata]
MLKVFVAVAIGAVLAGLASAAVINVASPSLEPPDKPLYNYGTR